jgi:hypothetical protein
LDRRVGSASSPTAATLRGDRIGHVVGEKYAGDLRPRRSRRHVENLGFVVEETREWFDPERSLILAAEIVGSRRVLFTAPVVEKMEIQTIGSALAFKAGDPVEAALGAALIAAICLKFDDQSPSARGEPWRGMG